MSKYSKYFIAALLLAFIGDGECLVFPTMRNACVPYNVYALQAYSQTPCRGFPGHNDQFPSI